MRPTCPANLMFRVFTTDVSEERIASTFKVEENAK
jgi:hypothetical protein